MCGWRSRASCSAAPIPIDEAHVKVFDKAGTLLKEIGKGTFKTVMNEIGYCAENDTVYIPEYGEKIWEIKGVDGELKQIIGDLPIGDHRNGGITCKDGYLYFALGLPSNTGFADPDNHGWPDIPNDPFWVKHNDGLGTTPHDPVCRDITHTGLNVLSSDGRMTGALMPVGVPAKPGQVIKAQVPCGGSIMRVKIDGKGADGMYAHEKMEVYAYRLPQSVRRRVRPEGHQMRERAGGLRQRRQRSRPSPRRQWRREALHRHREGPGRRLSRQGGLQLRHQQAVRLAGPITARRSTGRIRSLYIGDKPFVPKAVPYRFQAHLQGVRGVPLIVANPNPNGYINPVLEWDTNNPIDGIAWSAKGFGADNNLFGAVYGILDTGPESLVPTWPAVLRVEFLEPTGVKWSQFARNIEPGPNCLPEEGEPGRPGAAERRGVQQRRQDHVCRRLRRGLHRLHHAVAVLYRAEVRRDLGDHQGLTRLSRDDGSAARCPYCPSSLSDL